MSLANIDPKLIAAMSPAQLQAFLAVVAAQNPEQAKPVSTTAPPETEAPGDDEDAEEELGADGMPLDFDDEKAREESNKGSVPGYPENSDSNAVADIISLRVVNGEESGKSWYVMKLKIFESGDHDLLVPGVIYQQWFGFVGVPGWKKRQTKEYVRQVAAAAEGKACNKTYYANKMIQKLTVRDETSAPLRIKVMCKTTTKKIKNGDKAGQMGTFGKFYYHPHKA